ncbi:hypothetical protein PMKS-001476 [Pichia membranifaciens]|uniref:Uncharacterized protein n=1 Tax=Pichia membranifaciens TaxID=4926 RepID=A0A1Q2YER8_9ASCO|nr:hypothetical protein PMKS-001476 [Pichia membranifaciens]
MTNMKRILSYSNSNEEAIDDANLDQTWELRQDIQPHQQQQRTTKGSEEDSESEPRKLEPFKKLHKRSVSDNTECNISKQYKLDSLAASQSRDRDREGKTADVNVSSGLMIRHFDGK